MWHRCIKCHTQFREKHIPNPNSCPHEITHAKSRNPCNNTNTNSISHTLTHTHTHTQTDTHTDTDTQTQTNTHKHTHPHTHTHAHTHDAYSRVLSALTMVNVLICRTKDEVEEQRELQATNPSLPPCLCVTEGVCACESVTEWFLHCVCVCVCVWVCVCDPYVTHTHKHTHTHTSSLSHKPKHTHTRMHLSNIFMTIRHIIMM